MTLTLSKAEAAAVIAALHVYAQGVMHGEYENDMEPRDPRARRPD